MHSIAANVQTKQVGSHNQHSQIMGMGTMLDTKQMQTIQQKVQKIIDRKKRARQGALQDTSGPLIMSETQPDLGSCPNSGIQHLKKLQLVPENFSASKEGTQEMEQPSKSKCKNSLTIQPRFDFDMEQMMGNDCACANNVNKQLVKSGKYVKSNVNLVRQEVWLHTAVSKKYARRMSFDNIDFEQFVAGEPKIVHAMMVGGQELESAVGCLSVDNDCSLDVQS